MSMYKNTRYTEAEPHKYSVKNFEVTLNVRVAIGMRRLSLGHYLHTDSIDESPFMHEQGAEIMSGRVYCQYGTTGVAGYERTRCFSRYEYVPTLTLGKTEDKWRYTEQEST